MAENLYTLDIESNPNNLITVEEFVNYFCLDLKVDEEKIPGILLAVTEATTNAIIHGNKCDASKSVKISARVENKDLLISIKDEGHGFDPGKVPDPTKPENLLKDSGRGLYLMRVYMDDLKYNVTPDGTETILTLKLNSGF
ncbi:MAG: ATP-binding protein [Ignavibacteriales bacterium]|nr:MAG: ATP-binding protein [Ignavibacteriales bacterium]